ncbi:MAG: fibronectin type III domain-containing protein [Acidimicrobiales bacterium]|nr:fibronectin type III domain-containing protein [Acidimicrobiales bacterium]
MSVVSTGPTSAEIRWESAECVGSLYQVGDFSEGRGGYPNVDRCWFNHVVLAGNESFSPPLTPNTEYVVRVQAVNKSGQTSDPVEVTFRTTSG